MRNFESDRGNYFPNKEAIDAGLTWSASAEAWITPQDDGADVSLVPDVIAEFCPNDPQLAMVVWYQWVFKIDEFLRKEKSK